MKRNDMAEHRPNLAMERAGAHRLVLIPRDPYRGYVYWEWPDDGERFEAELVVVACSPGGTERRIGRYDVDGCVGGRFVDLRNPGWSVYCEVTHGDETRRSEMVEVPRSEAGSEPPRYVRVQLTDGGLISDPTEQSPAGAADLSAPQPTTPSSK